MEHETTVEELKEQIVALKAVLSRAKIVKEDSDYFRSNKDETPIRYRNLSETKKYMESKHSDILDTFKEQNGGKLMTSDEFHKLVAQKIGA